MGNFFLFLIGFGLAIAGGITIIAYMNFLPAGISWGDYFRFISSRIECYFLPTGFIFMMMAIQRMYKMNDDHT